MAPNRILSAGPSWSRSVVLFAGALVAAVACHVAKAAAADYYDNKQISIVVGSAAGGGYDAYSRLLARHFDRHVRRLVPRPLRRTRLTSESSEEYEV